MRTFRVLAVDDEPLARELLRDLLERDPEVELVGLCGDGVSALQAIRRHQPEIVFLDIEMPERTGLEVAQALTSMAAPPVVVFVTAYSQHAPQAFDVEATDYLVKPFSDERFFKALGRAKQRIRERQQGESQPSARPNQEHQSPPETYLERLTVQTAGRSKIVKTRDIAWIESCDYYSRVHTSEAAHLVRVSLTAFEKKLDPRRFIRVHRQAIVNVDEARAVEPGKNGRREVVLADGTRLAISRSRQKAVEELLVPPVTR